MNIIKIEDQISRVGESLNYAISKYKDERTARLKDEVVYDQTMAFIFGESVDNPLKNITDNEKRDLSNLDSRVVFLLSEAKKIADTKKFK